MNWHEVYLHMKAGTALDEAHQRELSVVLEKYPFFAMGRIMMAKVATKLNDPRAQQLRFLGALYAPSRQHYAFFLEEKMRPRVAPPPRMGAVNRESQTPARQSEKKDEQSTSGEEPGPAEMPYSEAFLPSLQGWIAARQVLYNKLGRRVRASLIILSEGSLSPPKALSESPATEREPPVEHPTPSAPPPEAHPSSTRASPPSESLSLPVKPFLPPETAIPVQISLFSPLRVINILQFELPLSHERQPSPSIHKESPMTPSENPMTVPSQAELPSSPQPPATMTETALPEEAISETLQEQFHRSYVPLEETHASIHVEAPSEALSPQEETALPTEALQEQFHRSYVPLEETHASIHVEAPSEAPSPQEETALPTEALREQFHRSYIPLEETESVIHLSPEGSETTPMLPPTTPFLSESPIRSFVPLDIDVEASIHLPVPEPTASEEIGNPSMPVMTTEAAGESLSELEPKVVGGWQSFLAELQKELPLPEASPSPGSKELEGLRREFIRRLLAQRLVQPHTISPHQEENLIDLLLKKLEAFQPQSAPPSEREVPELTIPGWDLSPSTPRVYTETMARLYWSQGDLVHAIQVYEALIEKHPENADHYRRQIERIRAGEMP